MRARLLVAARCGQGPGPAGSLPQQAERLDPSGPMRPNEIEVAVERLCLDSTSFREIHEHSGGDPARWRIAS